jgi:hypothetical protein
VAAAIRQEKAGKQRLADLMQALTQRADELAAARLAADDYVQDSGDTKEEGETGDEEQEAEDKDGEVKGQAGPAPPAGESGGGCAFAFSSSPVDKGASFFPREEEDVRRGGAGGGDSGQDTAEGGRAAAGAARQRR